MHLDQIVPLGRSAADYRAMFALQPDDRTRRLLGCGDGPAAFNAGWTGEGGRVVSLDPLYAWPVDAVRQRIEATFPDIVRRMHAEPERFALAAGETIDTLADRRWAAMQCFLADYADGGRAGRYVAGALARLPFADDAFDLALCSHLLFLYEAQLSRTFHRRALRELLRVAREVRVFPLVNLEARPSAYLAPMRTALSDHGAASEIVKVGYEVQRGARHMLRITRSSAHSFPDLDIS
ncbi:hypothetical protein CKO28_08365 [Rhodovibrio sodomensis]|uniref:Methyltransferase type 11 domain-containing protein n=1 Tax=Rhodovibrio sodomensis TaxID=1088 RepID=A0ABS1DC88_9PROT|nr:methyltransferase domain-containing protein [Rhodovibrio sodomensis]MBK1668049.1 hypothetical protein [Rhodovibrio sodomensis]